MAPPTLTRLVAGTHREVWQQTAAVDGGTSQTCTTGIRLNSLTLSRVFGVLKLANMVGVPSITATPSVVDGRLVVTVTNAAAPGASATWLLDIWAVHSVQQGRDDDGVGAIHVIAPPAAAAGGATFAPYENAEGAETTLAAAAPETLYEARIDLSQLPLGVTRVSFIAAGMATWNDDVQSVATFKLYIGGALCGTLVFNDFNETYLQSTTNVFNNTGGSQLLTITGENNQPATDVSQIRNIEVRIG